MQFWQIETEPSKLHYGSDFTVRVSLRVVLYSKVIVRSEYFIFMARYSLENDKF